MANWDLYTATTFLLAVALAVIGVELMLKKIPQKDEFISLRVIRAQLVVAFLLTSTCTVIEFLFCDKYHFETAAFFNLSLVAYQFVLLSPAIIACLPPPINTTD